MIRVVVGIVGLTSVSTGANKKFWTLLVLVVLLPLSNFMGLSTEVMI